MTDEPMTSADFAALRRDAHLFLIVMCLVSGVVGFLLGFAACAIAGSI